MGITEFTPPRVDEPAGKGKAKAGGKGKPAAPPAEPAIRWDDRLRLGVEEIDDQHQALIGYCNELVESLRKGQGTEAVSVLVNRLRDYTVGHFAAEERYMQGIGYPGLERQRTAHAGLLRRVKDLQRRIYQHQDPTPAEVRAFLKDWLVGHILGEDLQISAFLAAKSAPPPEPEPAGD